MAGPIEAELSGKVSVETFVIVSVWNAVSVCVVVGCATMLRLPLELAAMAEVTVYVTGK